MTELDIIKSVEENMFFGVLKTGPDKSQDIGRNCHGGNPPTRAPSNAPVLILHSSYNAYR